MSLSFELIWVDCWGLLRLGGLREDFCFCCREGTGPDIRHCRRTLTLAEMKHAYNSPILHFLRTIEMKYARYSNFCVAVHCREKCNPAAFWACCHEQHRLRTIAKMHSNVASAVSQMLHFERVAMGNTWERSDKMQCTAFRRNNQMSQQHFKWSIVLTALLGFYLSSSLSFLGSHVFVT